MAGFQANYDGIGEMLCSPGMQAEMLRRARRVMEAAIADAPYDPKDRDGNHYKDGFSVDAGIQERKTRRAFGRVTNDNEAAFLVEYGSKNNPAHHTLTRALDAAKD